MTGLGVIIIDTNNYVLANNALINTINKIKPSHILTYTDNDKIWNQYDKKIIKKIESIEDYNKLILNKIKEDIYLDHYLFIQYDGFVINENLFDKSFLNFDYIGAHWPQFQTKNIGNGGFSLRSKRLIETAAHYSNFRAKNLAEDIFICRHLHDILTFKHNLKFADYHTAEKFSFEAPNKNTTTFGFHGVLNLPLIYQYNLYYLFENLTVAFIRKRKNELLYGLQKIKAEENLDSRDFYIKKLLNL